MQRTRSEPDLSNVVAVIRPATQPKNNELKLFVGASLPKNIQIDVEPFKRLQAKYLGRLMTKTAPDGRTCITLPCETAANLEEAGIQADQLGRDISELLGIREIKMIACGYAPMCEKLDLRPDALRNFFAA